MPQRGEKKKNRVNSASFFLFKSLGNMNVYLIWRQPPREPRCSTEVGGPALLGASPVTPASCQGAMAGAGVTPFPVIRTGLEGLPFTKEKHPGCRKRPSCSGEGSPAAPFKHAPTHPCIENARVIKPFAERLPSHLAG